MQEKQPHPVAKCCVHKQAPTNSAVVKELKQTELRQNIFLPYSKEYLLISWRKCINMVLFWLFRGQYFHYFPMNIALKSWI